MRGDRFPRWKRVAVRRANVRKHWPFKLKQNRRGPKLKYQPEQLRLFLFDQMEHHGDFYPGDFDWGNEADLMRALIEKFGMVESTAKALLKHPLAEWRKTRTRAEK